MLHILFPNQVFRELVRELNGEYTWGPRWRIEIHVQTCVLF